MIRSLCLLSSFTSKQVRPKKIHTGRAFRQIYAEICVKDKAVVQKLSLAKPFKDIVTIRCGNVDVTGPVSKTEHSAGETRFIVAVDDLMYHGPTSSYPQK